MPTYNEAQIAGMILSVPTGDEMKDNELQHAWLTSKGVPLGGTLDERWRVLFNDPGNTFEGAAHAWLTAQGVPEGGTFNERFTLYWTGIVIPMVVTYLGVTVTHLAETVTYTGVIT